MNAPAIRLPHWLLTLHWSRLRSLTAGTSFLLLIALVVNVLWLLEFLLWKVPRLGATAALHAALPFVLGNLWLTMPPQVGAAIILNLAPVSPWRRAAHFGAAFVWLLGWCMYWDAAGPFSSAWSPANPFDGLHYIAGEFEASITAILFLWAFCYYRTASRTQDGLVQAQIAASAVDAELQRARLQLLRAQIEPHFLFNTHANVRSLARIELTAAVQLMDHLMQYFAAALPRMRQDEAALADEMQLIDAYLAIYRVRMGRRLAYEISLPRELAAARVPTMILLTLVENALKHGINPTIEGGLIRVSAARVGSTLVLKVADSGCGLKLQQGYGSGLSNTRTRLRMRYGQHATLSLSPAEPRGVVALVRIAEFFPA
jgi:hypothetical protein